MDFHSLARRDLQALCKLNAIPANLTNVAMADALKSLNIVEGIEEFLNRSPERKAVTAAKVPRTGRRTCTKSIPIGDASESVQPMTKSTRRTTRRAISDEIMEESKTPAIRTSRKTVEPAKTESEGIENLEMKGVTDTPALATYTRRNQVARKSSVKEVTTVQRVYSTRRSARLTENKAVEEEKEEKIDSLVTELSRFGLGDGSDNKSLSGNDAEVVLPESVEKLDESLVFENEKEDAEVVLQESAEKLDESLVIEKEDADVVLQEPVEKLDESLVIENGKESGVPEEIVDVLGEKSKQLDASQLVADSVLIKDEDNKVLGYPMDTENSHEQEKSDEAAPESGMEPEGDDVQEIVVDELKEKSEDESHFVQEVNANNMMIEDVESKVEKPLKDSDNAHEQLNYGAGGEFETNKNLESVVLATAELSAGGESYLVEQMTYSDESKDDILDNNDLVEPSIGDSHVTCFEESKADILDNNYPKEIATGTEANSISSFVSSGGAENKTLTKTPSVKELNSVSDDKENVNRNGIKFEPAKEEAMINKKKELNDKSLRELTRMLKEKLQISNSTAEEIGKVTKERPALQKLEDNCQW